MVARAIHLLSGIILILAWTGIAASASADDNGFTIVFNADTSFQKITSEVKQVQGSVEENRKNIKTLEQLLEQQNKILQGLKNFIKQQFAAQNNTLLEQKNMIEKQLQDIINKQTTLASDNEQSEERVKTELKQHIDIFENKLNQNINNNQNKLQNEIDEQSKQVEAKIQAIANEFKLLPNATNHNQNLNRVEITTSKPPMAQADLEKLAPNILAAINDVKQIIGNPQMAENPQSLHEKQTHLINNFERLRQDLENQTVILQDLQKAIKDQNTTQNTQFSEQQNSSEKTQQDIKNLQNTVANKIKENVENLLTNLADESVKQNQNVNKLDLSELNDMFQKINSTLTTQNKQRKEQFKEIADNLKLLLKNSNISQIIGAEECTLSTSKPATEITPNEYLTNLKNKPNELQQSMPEILTLIDDLKEIIELLEDSPTQTDGYTTHLPTTATVVEVNNAVSGARSSNCNEAIKRTNSKAAKAGIYALDEINSGYCIPDPNGGKAWLVIQRHISNDISFDRDWIEYKNGFGNLNGDFFVGLETIYKMTKLSNKSTELWIQLGTSDGDTPYQIYSHFFISNEKGKYKLGNLYAENGTAGDELTQIMGSAFQTKNVEWLDKRKCPQRNGSGWWFTTQGDFCGGRNLNTILEEISWSSWSNINYTHMAIRHTDEIFRFTVTELDSNDKSNT